MELKEKRWVRVMCFKHDGSLHRIWDKAGLIYEDEEKIIISNSKTLIREHNNRMWMAKEPSATIFYKKRWFNIMGIIREEGVHYYCNIASPCIFENEVIKYIDYDLDLVKTVDNKIKVVDKNEYAQNKIKYIYSEKLDKVLKEELSLLKKWASKGLKDFDDSLIHESNEIFVKKFLKGE